MMSSSKNGVADALVQEHGYRCRMDASWPSGTESLIRCSPSSTTYQAIEVHHRLPSIPLPLPTSQRYQKQLLLPGVLQVSR